MSHRRTLRVCKRGPPATAASVVLRLPIGGQRKLGKSFRLQDAERKRKFTLTLNQRYRTRTEAHEFELANRQHAPGARPAGSVQATRATVSLGATAPTNKPTDPTQRKCQQTFGRRGLSFLLARNHPSHPLGQLGWLCCNTNANINTGTQTRPLHRQRPGLSGQILRLLVRHSGPKVAGNPTRVHLPPPIDSTRMPMTFSQRVALVLSIAANYVKTRPSAGATGSRTPLVSWPPCMRGGASELATVAHSWQLLHYIPDRTSWSYILCFWLFCGWRAIGIRVEKFAHAKTLVFNRPAAAFTFCLVRSCKRHRK